MRRRRSRSQMFENNDRMSRRARRFLSEEDRLSRRGFSRSRLNGMKRRLMEEVEMLDERVIPKTIPVSLQKEINKAVAKYWYEAHSGTADVGSEKEVYDLIQRDAKVNKRLMAFFKAAAKLANLEFDDDALY